MKINRAQARLYRFLRKDIVHHLGFGAAVLVIVFCFLAIHAWYEGKAELLETFDYKREAFWKVFREALGYTLLMGVPVYFNLFFIYKGRLQAFLGRKILTKAQIKSWSFYLFLILSFFTAVIFSLAYRPLIRSLFDIVNQQWYELVIVILFLILCTTGVSFTKDAIERSREMDRRARLDSIRRRKEAERQLKFIKKQIRPHFLFNTLANLQVLAHRKSEKLPNLIGELSRLLRHLVYKTNERLVPLEEELMFIKSYLQLQRLQLSSNTCLEYEEVGQVMPQYRIAPMVLLLFVENCFKHYNSGRLGQRQIRIHFRIQSGRLKATIQNTYKANTRNEDTMVEQAGNHGLGLSAAVENLDLVYQGLYQLDIEKNDSLFTVKLELPLS